MAKAQYDHEYYESFNRVTMRSAEIVVPIVMELLAPRSVCDVGCGPGIWLSVFAEHGVDEVLGMDGDYVERATLQIDPEKFIPADLSQGVPRVGSFDLAVSLEVAEHLPGDSAKGFVEGLVSLAPAVLFSAAVPGQGGLGHVNEQWPTYWRKLFREHDYELVDCVRPRIWGSGKVKFWYRQNMLLFVKGTLLESSEALQRERRRAAAAPVSIVHPRQFRLALERPWVLWRELAAEVEAGRLTTEQQHERMAELLAGLANQNEEDEDG
jgi:SAM-dependent methyltransferase